MSEMRSENHSFVLRLWRGKEGADWRGRVQHAASGRIQYFHDLADFVSFVEAFTRPLSNSVSRSETKLK